MVCHPGMVKVEELDQIAQEEIGQAVGKPVYVKQYRDPCNSTTEILCNGNLLVAGSNYQMKQKIMEMKRKGTLVPYFQQKAMFQKGI